MMQAIGDHLDVVRKKRKERIFIEFVNIRA